MLRARIDASRLSLPAPFDPDRVSLVASIADVIVRWKGDVAPGIKYLGFWTRRAALRHLERNFLERCPADTLSRPRGMVFHLPPKNVETIFLYSWILSYLAGNANIVRMPQAVGGDVMRVLDRVIAALDAAHDPSQMFVHYPADNDLSEMISAHSDARVVWGGDAKIATFERMPLRNGGKSIWFGDRSSLCVLDGAVVAALDGAGLADLAQRFANDIFLFDQMACSSPHALYVVGRAPEHLAAIKALLDLISQEAAGKGSAVAAGHQIAKMTAGFSAAASGQATEVLWRAPQLTSIISETAARADRSVGGGFLSVVFLNELAGLNDLLRDKDQTITHFGFATSDIRRAAERHLGPGVARWTPVGLALEFDSIWDGYDILMETTRLCRVG
ncbi:hypothetical protein LWE61_19605 [Sphingobium sufflavum]|uniref:acyl-CoA reductase n=1 Tax=Sphingobium sufflavum TaxID=1129547 RepID=UPI001F3B99D1|nr:acyl-CoA reductase [Sphingobium sufflavum]MCE7798739.1 hypothetical protein [Sphingobium sufflavum]